MEAGVQLGKVNLKKEPTGCLSNDKLEYMSKNFKFQILIPFFQVNKKLGLSL